MLLLLEVLDLVLLSLHGRVGLLDARVDDVLRLAFFLLGRHLVDDLLLILLLLGGQESSLLGCELLFSGLVGALLAGMVVRASALEGWEEVIEQNTLSRLGLSALALGCLLLAALRRAL